MKWESSQQVEHKSHVYHMVQENLVSLEESQLPRVTIE